MTMSIVRRSFCPDGIISALISRTRPLQSKTMTSIDYLLPQLPFGSAEYTIVRWLKRAGDNLAAGDPLLVVVNDRVEAALPATCAGILECILVAEGAAAAPGALAATINASAVANIGDLPVAAR